MVLLCLVMALTVRSGAQHWLGDQPVAQSAMVVAASDCELAQSVQFGSYDLGVCHCYRGLRVTWQRARHVSYCVCGGH